METGCIPLASSAAPMYPYMALARGAHLLVQRKLCCNGLFYDCYLDESQLHCGVMLIIVSTKLDLLSPPPFPSDLKLSLLMQSYPPLGDFSVCFQEGKTHALNRENIALISLYSGALAFSAQLPIHFYNFHIEGIKFFVPLVIKWMR